MRNQRGLSGRSPSRSAPSALFRPQALEEAANGAGDLPIFAALPVWIERLPPALGGRGGIAWVSPPKAGAPEGGNEALGLALRERGATVKPCAMPLPDPVRISIKTIREFIAASGGVGRGGASVAYQLMRQLFDHSGQLLEDAETLDAVLALGPEIDSYRGKGSQAMQADYSRFLAELVDYAALGLPPSANGAPGADQTPPPWAEKLSDHFLARLKEKPGKSRHAGSLRADAWSALGGLSHFMRRSEHLDLALATASSSANSLDEREAAVGFLLDYWADEEPDKATVALLGRLSQEAPSRSFLVAVHEVQVEFGLIDELSAMCDLEDWDECEDED